ncbi:hypothetical protein UJ101_02266 [Flavobacteriaceae bacterium UJ101]|nr:hypothetical protein UJ101_02266 [Flavobacteriaceae bacterium UJ101]
MQNRTFLEYFILYFKGILMGTANKVPGVSGGMVALVTGFYEELIYSFQKINAKAFGLWRKRGFKAFAQYTNLKFLAAVNLGSASAYFTISLLLDYFIRNFPLMVWSTFFGMIIGSIIYVRKDVQNWSLKTITFCLLGAIIGLAISFMDPMTQNEALWFVFLCGIISVSGMALPGFSGSFILILIGNYTLLLVDAVNNLLKAIVSLVTFNWSFFEVPHHMHLLYVVAIFTLGATIGLIIFSNIIGYLLKKFHDSVIATLIGFIIGSLGAAWPWRIEKSHIREDGVKVIESYERFLPDLSQEENWLSIGFIILGIFIILIFDHYDRKRKGIRTLI